MRILVHYPRQEGLLGLRTDDDWAATIDARSVSTDGTVHQFEVRSARPYVYFKPVLEVDGDLRWSRGDNYLALQHALVPREVYPYFRPDDRCTVCERRELTVPGGAMTHAYRVFHPPGYDENTLKRYPVLYMQDGQNLFFPEESAFGSDWKIQQTLTLLADMNAVDKVIVVGVEPAEREREYTSPGYDAYGRFLVENLKPLIDAQFRTLDGPQHTAVMGSSLGGVVSFHAAWRWPEVFGKAACLSSTFGWRDDLHRRVEQEEKRDVTLYLDSGWPHDNYEVTRDMRELLVGRGFTEGRDLHYFAFPEALHNERYWAMRSHIPFQLFFGRPARPPLGPSVT